MKLKFVFIPVLLVVMLLSACANAATPTTEQNPTAIVTEVKNTVVPATVAPTSYPVVTIKLNASQQQSYAPIYIADAEGYFAEFGIKLESYVVKKNQDVLPLLATGDIDVYAGGLNPGLINVLLNTPNVKVVADRGHNAPGDCAYQALVVRKDLFDNGQVTSAKDLKGLTISASASGMAGWVLSAYMQTAGLSPADADVKDVPKAGFVDAFANKSLAVISTSEPSISRLLAAGNAVILADATDILGSMQIGVLAFSPTLIKDNPDIAIRFLAAYLKGVQKYNEGKTERNVDIITEATGETRETILDSCWVPINVDGKIDFPGVDKFQQWSIEQKQLDLPITEEQFWDPSFLASAMKLLGQ